MKYMSFFLTQQQIREKTKTVTRRSSAGRYKVGDVRQPVVRQRGLKKGEHYEPIGGLIEFTSVRAERLDSITFADVALEGFFGLGPSDFVALYCRHNGGRRDQTVWRIAFKYL